MKGKSKWVLGALVLGGMGCVRQPLVSPPPPPGPSPRLESESPDWWQVYFSRLHEGNVALARADAASIDRHLVRFLSRAHRSIEAALHELDNDRIAAALIAAHRRGVRVRVLTETDYRDEASIEALEQASVPVRDDQGRPSLMHHKFLVVDGQAVWTGSFNTTDNGAFKNDNNALLIYSPQVASLFTAEFNKLFDRREFGRPASQRRPPPAVRMPDGTEVQVLFSPEHDVAEAIQQEIQRARQTLRFLAFSFTHNGIGQAMLGKMRQGVSVQGVLETRGSDAPASEFARFKKARLEVLQDANPYLMHHKVILIDRDTVITGSFNFSRNAAESNQENVVILRGNQAIAEAYRQEYERIYQAAARAGHHPRVAASPKPSRPPSGRRRAEPAPQPSPRQARVNVNTASLEELATLPGVGPELARQIVRQRPYRKVEDLLRIHGIGQGKLKQLRQHVTVR